jgi:GrpB-like predicted nucleotidyltransferase (UPF0157 family)
LHCFKKSNDVNDQPPYQIKSFYFLHPPAFKSPGAMPNVLITPYSNDWPRHFAEAQAQLAAAFGSIPVLIEHIGSTAIPGLAAKPVIDVLLGAQSLAAIEDKTEALQSLGFDYIRKYEAEIPVRRYFVRLAARSPRVNLHAVVYGSRFWREHLVFREALRTDPVLALEYAELKIWLAGQFSADRMSYSAAKAPFIRSVLRMALPPSYFQAVRRPSGA